MTPPKRFRPRQHVVLSHEAREKLVDQRFTRAIVVGQRNELVTVRIDGRERSEEFHADFLEVAP